MATVNVTRGDGFRQISRRWAAQRINISPVITAWSNALMRHLVGCWMHLRASTCSITQFCSLHRITVATSRREMQNTSGPATTVQSVFQQHCTVPASMVGESFSNWSASLTYRQRFSMPQGFPCLTRCKDAQFFH